MLLLWQEAKNLCKAVCSLKETLGCCRVHSNNEMKSSLSNITFIELQIPHSLEIKHGFSICINFFLNFKICLNYISSTQISMFIHCFAQPTFRFRTGFRLKQEMSSYYNLLISCFSSMQSSSRKPQSGVAGGGWYILPGSSTYKPSNPL